MANVAAVGAHPYIVNELGGPATSEPPIAVGDAASSSSGSCIHEDSQSGTKSIKCRPLIQICCLGHSLGIEKRIRRCANLLNL